jgi:hypothetical protein
MNHISSPSENLRTDLARTLGFPNYPHDAAAEPYLNYLTNRCIGSDTTEAYIELLIMVVKYFDRAPADSSAMKSVQGLLDVVSSSPAYAQRNHEDIEDTVLFVIGTWTLLLSSFVHLPMAGGLRLWKPAVQRRLGWIGSGQWPTASSHSLSARRPHNTQRRVVADCCNATALPTTIVSFVFDQPIRRWSVCLYLHR